MVFGGAGQYQSLPLARGHAEIASIRSEMTAATLDS